MRRFLDMKFDESFKSVHDVYPRYFAHSLSSQQPNQPVCEDDQIFLTLLSTSKTQCTFMTAPASIDYQATEWMINGRYVRDGYGHRCRRTSNMYKPLRQDLYIPKDSSAPGLDTFCGGASHFTAISE